jgi:putative ABC transport system permease protein
VQVHVAGEDAKPDGISAALTMTEDLPLLRELAADPRVEASVRRLKIEGLIETEGKSTYFLGCGVSPGDEDRVSPRLFTKNDDGVFVREGSPDGAVLAKGLARSLGLDLGEEATLVAGTAQGSVNGVDITVQGIVDAAIPSFTQREVFVPLAKLQRLVRLPGRISELALRLVPSADPDAFIADYAPRAQAAGLRLIGIAQIEPLIGRVEVIWHAVIAATVALLFLSTALSVTNVVSMMVAERTVEIGTMMAIGARPRDVFALFAAEAALISLIGGAAGAVVGVFAVWLLGRIGVPFHSPFGPELLVVRPTLELGTVAAAYAGAVLLAVLAALVPARRAARVSPVRAFRGQLT